MNPGDISAERYRAATLGIPPVLTTSVESKIERAIDQLKNEAGEPREAWRDDATKHLNQALELVRKGRIKPVEV